MIDQLHCAMTYGVYKFQPEICAFAACCDAEIINIDHDIFNELGENYFELHPRLIKRKEDLYNNIKNSDCKQCWQKEAQGLRSMRQEQSPLQYMLHGNRNLDVRKSYTGRIELWMNSTCNLGCFMCHLGNSNTLRKIWWKDKNYFGTDGYGFNEYMSKLHIEETKPKFEEYMLKFILKAIKETPTYELTIAYLGGEPTLHSEMYDHADIFIEAGRETLKNKDKKLSIEITTNGTSKDKLNERFYRMFEKYKEAGWTTRIMLSQDGAHDQAQVRHGADFNQIRRNFSNWLKPDSAVDKVTSFTVVSNLNLPYIDEMAEYMYSAITENYTDNKKLSVSFNALIQPKWMQIKYLPREFGLKPTHRAKELFEDLDDRYDNLYYQRGLFENIISTLNERPSDDDITFFFNTLNYTNSVYQKTYPDWDFYKQFPHLNQIKQMYGIE
jgi:organic radical activating enzyme